jgi:hypothetical protein
LKLYKSFYKKLLQISAVYALTPDFSGLVFCHGQSVLKGQFLQYVNIGINGTRINPNIENTIRIPKRNQENSCKRRYTPAPKGMNHKRERIGMKNLNFLANWVSSFFLKNLPAIYPNPVVQVAVLYKGQ